MNLTSICGVILTSNNPKKLANFYSDVFDVSFEREQHGDLLEHFGVDIGQVHLGIHPPKNMGMSEVGNSSISIAYNIRSLNDVLGRLAERNATEVFPPHDEGFGIVASYKDPEGNRFEIVELSYDFENK